MVLAPHIISFDFHQICYVFDGFGGFGCSCLFWWFWWILVGSPWGTPYHSLWFLSDLVVFGGFGCFCLFWLFCWFWHPLSFPLISIRFASLFDGFGVFFLCFCLCWWFWWFLVRSPWGTPYHSLRFLSDLVVFGGFGCFCLFWWCWWFWHPLSSPLMSIRFANLFDGFGGFGCFCLFWWFWWFLVGSPWGTPSHSL